MPKFGRNELVTLYTSSMNALPIQLLSPSHLAGNLRRPVSSVLNAARELGIEPALTINAVGHFDAEQSERIAEHLQRTKRQTRE